MGVVLNFKDTISRFFGKLILKECDLQKIKFNLKRFIEKILTDDSFSIISNIPI